MLDGRVDQRRWPTDAVVFALANPDPEVDPAEADKYAAVVASGRSDYPNQINNVLAFPGVFRGLLDARAKEITTEMLLRAADGDRARGQRRGAQPELHHPQRLPPRRAQGRGRGDPGAVDRAGGRLDRVTTTLGNFTATDIDGDDVDLSSYDGKVVLVVNTASQCGMTPQYAGLQELYDRRQSDGWGARVPVRPVRQPEPGTEAEIAAFCESSYGVTFPMFAKVEVNGDDEHPLYTWLKGEKAGPRGADIDWNFTKFLLDRDGDVLDRFGPTTTPEEIDPRGSRRRLAGGVAAAAQVLVAGLRGPQRGAHDAGPVAAAWPARSRSRCRSGAGTRRRPC